MLCTCCPTSAWCLSCPHYKLCLTATGFGSHSPSCSFSTLALCSLEESRAVSGIKEQHHLKAGGVVTQLQRHKLLIPGVQSCHPWPCGVLWGCQPDSRVVEADPTVVAVCGAIAATHWLQVPWASHPGPPILGNATGVLAAVKLWKQLRISLNLGMKPPSILPPPPRLQLLLGGKLEPLFGICSGNQEEGIFPTEISDYALLPGSREAGWLWVRQSLMKAVVIGSPSAPQRILPDRAALLRVLGGS